MDDKQRLEAIKRDLTARAKQAKKTAEGMVGYGDCGISFAGIATTYEYILIEHFGEKCPRCKKKKIIITEFGLCEECILAKQAEERRKAGIVE